MSELTKEYFEQHLSDQLKGLATKEDLKPLATKANVHEGVEELARIIAETVANPMEARFNELEKLLEVRLRVDNLESLVQHNFKKLEEALHIKF